MVKARRHDRAVLEITEMTTMVFKLARSAFAVNYRWRGFPKNLMGRAKKESLQSLQPIKFRTKPDPAGWGCR
jgi:hypothetical protein